MAKKAIISVSGLHCPMCTSFLEAELKKIHGIQSIVFDYSKGNAVIYYDEHKADAGKFEEVIIKSGLKANVDRAKGELVFQKDIMIACVFLSLSFLVCAVKFFEADLGLGFDLRWLQAIFTIPVLYSGRQFYLKGLKDVLQRNISSDFFILLASFGLIVFSLASLILNLGRIYFLQLSFLIVFFLFTRHYELFFKSRIGNSAVRYSELLPAEAVILKNGKELHVAIEKVRPGDIVVVHQGKRIPADGIIVEGRSEIDSSFLGKSHFCGKWPGDSVVAGSLNKAGLIKVKVTKAAGDFALDKLITNADEAIWNLPSSGGAARAFFSRLNVFGIFFSLFAFFGWLFFSKDLNLSFLLFSFVLLSLYSCVLGFSFFSVPAGYDCAARAGIFFKDANSFEKFQKADTFVFEKTNVLTGGRPEVSDIYSCFGYDNRKVLEWAFIAERQSNHFLGRAIVKKAESEKIKSASARGFKEFSGKGVSAVFNRKKIFVGNRLFMQENDLDFWHVENEMRTFEHHGKTVVLVGLDKSVIGFIAFFEPLKEEAKEFISELHWMKKKAILLTSENVRTADAVARQLEIDDVVSEILPKDKATILERIKNTGRKVIFVFNDGKSGSFSGTEMGIIIGSQGYNTSADVSILSSDLFDIINSMKIAGRIRFRLLLGFFLSISYYALILFCGLGISYLAYWFKPIPVFAGVYASFASFISLLNSLQLSHFKMSYAKAGHKS